MKVAIRSVVIPSTIKKDFHGIELLARFTRINGNLSSIIVNENMLLIDGWRDLVVNIMLGNTEIDVVVNPVPDDQVVSLHKEMSKYPPSFDIPEHKKVFLERMEKMSGEALVNALRYLNI